MVAVTPRAAEKLREGLRAETADPEVAIRLIPSPSMPNWIEMVLSKEEEGDQVVESEGMKILLLGPEIAQALEGMVIDYEETPQGARFTITRISSGA